MAIALRGVGDGCQGACQHEQILGGPPHPVIVTIKDNRDDIRILLYSYYTTITGWGVLLR